MLEGAFTAKIRPAQIDVHEHIPVLGVGFHDGTKGCAPGARHQNIKLPIFLDGSLHQGGNGLFVGDISGNGKGLSAGLSTFLDNSV